MKIVQKIFKTISFVLVMQSIGWAQKLEHYDILLFDISQSASEFQLSNARLLTHFNPDGYNNQPHFFADQEIWVTSQTRYDTTQTDIQSLHFGTRVRTQITQTRTSEYSPTPMPDGKHFSAIVVEDDGSQRLWKFPKAGEGNGQPLLPDLTGVGYHAWLDETNLACFIVGEPHYLAHVQTNHSRQRRIASNVGRCLQKHPKTNALYFVVKATDQTWFIKSYQPDTEKQSIICTTLSGSEDFVILEDGTLIMGQNQKLFAWKREMWVPIADLSIYGVKKISRLASRNGKLAIVVQF